MKKYHETWKIENIKQILLGQIHNDNENDDAIFCLKNWFDLQLLQRRQPWSFIIKLTNVETCIQCTIII